MSRTGRQLMTSCKPIGHCKHCGHCPRPAAPSPIRPPTHLGDEATPVSPTALQKHVAGLEVAVHDAAGVQVAHALKPHTHGARKAMNGKDVEVQVSAAYARWCWQQRVFPAGSRGDGRAPANMHAQELKARFRSLPCMTAQSCPPTPHSHTTHKMHAADTLKQGDVAPADGVTLAVPRGHLSDLAGCAQHGTQRNPRIPPPAWPEDLALNGALEAAAVTVLRSAAWCRVRGAEDGHMLNVSVPAGRASRAGIRKARAPGVARQGGTKGALVSLTSPARGRAHVRSKGSGGTKACMPQARCTCWPAGLLARKWNIFGTLLPLLLLTAFCLWQPARCRRCRPRPRPATSTACPIIRLFAPSPP